MQTPRWVTHDFGRVMKREKHIACHAWLTSGGQKQQRCKQNRVWQRIYDERVNYIHIQKTQASLDDLVVVVVVDLVEVSVVVAVVVVVDLVVVVVNM